MGLRSILGYCGIVATLFVAPACAGTPVVLEYYGQNSCDKDYDMQKRLYEVVRRRSDVIFLNCRVLFTVDVDINLSEEEQERKREELSKRNSEEYGAPLFYNDFCSKRAEEYGQNINELVHVAVSSVVNGRWVASHYDVMAAVKLGATDNVKEVGLVRDGDVLHVKLPENMSSPKGGKGTLMLFVYAPSTGVNVGEPINVSMKGSLRGVDIDSLLSDRERLIPLEKENVQEDILGGDVETAEDFEEKLSAAQNRENKRKTFFFRPVAAIEKIGSWDGSKSQYDISLSTIALKTGINLDKMGYVVLLQDGSTRAAPVIGAGEIIPSGEKMPLPVSPAMDE